MANKTGLQFTARVGTLPEDTFAVVDFTPDEALNPPFTLDLHTVAGDNLLEVAGEQQITTGKNHLFNVNGTLHIHAENGSVVLTTPGGIIELNHDGSIRIAGKYIRMEADRIDLNPGNGAEDLSLPEPDSDTGEQVTQQQDQPGFLEGILEAMIPSASAAAAKATRSPARKQKNTRFTKTKWKPSESEINMVAHSELGNMIGEKESSNNYDIYRTDPYKKIRELIPTTMTIDEILEKQKNGSVMGAVGRYQIIRNTLVEAKKELSLTGNEKFDKAMQDRIFVEYLINGKREGIHAYLYGDGKIEIAAEQLAQEFASFPDESGETYYSKNKHNKALVTRKQVFDALKKTKKQIEDFHKNTDSSH